MCLLCKSFVLDYLQVPSVKGDPFHTHVRMEKMAIAAPMLAMEFTSFLNRINPSQGYMISNHTQIVMKDLLKDQGAKNHQEDVLQGIALYTAARKTLKGEMDVLTTLVEDSQILKRSMRSEAWLGTTLAFLWTHLGSIHAEHERKAICTYAGAALGLRIKEKVIDNRTEEQKEFDALYN